MPIKEKQDILKLIKVLKDYKLIPQNCEINEELQNIILNLANLKEEKSLVQNKILPLQKRLRKFKSQLKHLEEKNEELDCVLCQRNNEELDSVLCQNNSINNKKTSTKEDIEIGEAGIKQNIFRYLSTSHLISAKKDVHTEKLMLTDKVSQLKNDLKPDKLKLKKINEKLTLLQAKWERELFLQLHQNKQLLEREQLLQTSCCKTVSEKEELLQTNKLLMEVEKNVISHMKDNGFSIVIKLVNGTYSFFSLVLLASSQILPHIFKA